MSTKVWRSLRMSTWILSAGLNFCKRKAFMSMVPGGFPMPANIRHIYFSTRSTKKGEIAGGHVLLEINQCTGEGTPSVHPNVAPHSSLWNHITKGKLVVNHFQRSFQKLNGKEQKITRSPNTLFSLNLQDSAEYPTLLHIRAYRRSMDSQKELKNRRWWKEIHI